MSEQLWRPQRPEETQLAQFSKIAQKKFSLTSDSFEDLHKWSVTETDSFWREVWLQNNLQGLLSEIKYVSGNDFISSEFFPGSKINVAENLLYRGKDEAIAIVGITENGSRHEVTWKDLRIQVAATAAALSADGVEVGDRIAAWTPNIIETVIFALGGLSIGATISTASPDFAPLAVQDRFGQIEPKILLASRSYQYGGKIFDCSEKLVEIVKLLPTLKRTVITEEFGKWIAPYIGSSTSYAPLPFNHPGFVLFSSGTTGKPKCIVHSGAGVLIKNIVEDRYHFDIKEGDKVFFYTTCGWMMWNWLLMVLNTGATIVLFDGSPVFPDTSRLVDLVVNEQLTFMGLSAKLIDSMNKDGIKPIQSHDLKSLRTLASTGSVLSPESFSYVYESVKSDLHLASFSGGTDICGSFVAGIPTKDVIRGEIQGAVLGMAVDVFNSNGGSAATNEKGELVCTVPFPSKPIGFWNDMGNSGYKSAYFEGFPRVWTHGDFAAKTETGGFIIYGRSDATLNSKGVRIGTAEIYRVVEAFPEIQEAIAVSQDFDSDTRVILFVTMRPNNILSPDLVNAIKSALRSQASPRHVPDLILAAPALPRTKSNKLVELAVGDLINGREVRNIDSLANPEALEWFKRVY